jgi:ubiquinone/menaquinone biosynthesis C-methylase UbiE
MNSITSHTENCEVERVKRVEKFFDQAHNYLGRNGYDIRIRAETVSRFLGQRDFTSMLDLGCGDGSISLPLLTVERHLTLLDVSSNMLAVAQSRVPQELHDNVDLINCDFLQASLRPESYDVVICIGVLAHVFAPVDVLAKVASILKPGGLLILQCTDSSHFVRRFVDLYHRGLRFIRPALYTAAPLTNSGVLEMTEKQRLEVRARFRYSSGLPGFHRIFSQSTLYRMIRRIFGDCENNRNVWLGSENIYLLERQRQSERDSF